MIRADLIAAASAAADAAARDRDPRHATTTAHVVAAALPVIVGAVTDELRRLHVIYATANGWGWCASCRSFIPPPGLNCPTIRLLDALDAEAGRNEG